MGMHFEELDALTRNFMLREFQAEESGGHPYRGEVLNDVGRHAWPDLMANAIKLGNEESLAAALAEAPYWNITETYVRSGAARERRVNLKQASERLATSEFNTWYVRGLAARLLDERVTECQVYRAAAPRWAIAECSRHEGLVYPVQVVYDGHRRRYWPAPGVETCFAIPYQPGCHHTIRRVP
jgi:hypothetical protein